FLLFLFNVTATTEIYTLSLHDALPIYNSLIHMFDIFSKIHDLIFWQLNAYTFIGLIQLMNGIMHIEWCYSFHGFHNALCFTQRISDKNRGFLIGLILLHPVRHFLILLLHLVPLVYR